MSYQPDSFQTLALKTWYQPGSPLYPDPRHPLIKLAGEAGEILDLFGKHEYKPGFDWWACKHCKQPELEHSKTNSWCYPWTEKQIPYTPLVLDELGDWFYYARIVTWQQGVSVADWVKKGVPGPYKSVDNILFYLTEINHDSAQLLSYYVSVKEIPRGGTMQLAFMRFLRLMELLDCSIDHLTQLNYQKLNSEATSHGWRESEAK